MITPEIKADIKKILGTNPVRQIISHLTNIGIVNEKGEAYTPNNICQVLDWRWKNTIIAQSIIDFANHRKKINARNAKKLKI